MKKVPSDSVVINIDEKDIDIIITDPLYLGQTIALFYKNHNPIIVIGPQCIFYYKDNRESFHLRIFSNSHFKLYIPLYCSLGKNFNGNSYWIIFTLYGSFIIYTNSYNESRNTESQFSQAHYRIKIF